MVFTDDRSAAKFSAQKFTTYSIIFVLGYPQNNFIAKS